MKIIKERINLRGLLLFIMITFTISCLILASDESKEPLILEGNKLIAINDGYIESDAIGITDKVGTKGFFAKSSSYALKKGTYTIGIQYLSFGGGDNSITLIDNGLEREFFVLPFTSHYYDYIEYTFTLEKDSQEFFVNFDFNGTGGVFIYKFSLLTDTRFYTDIFLYIGLFLLFTVIFITLYLKNVLSKICPKTRYTALLLIGIGLLAQAPYLSGDFYRISDICYHLSRIEGIKDGLLDGQFPVVIYPEGLNGHGYLNSMYPSLFLYIPALLRSWGVSLTTSYKFLILLANILTPLVTYYSIKSFSISRKLAVFGALLYTLCPYRYTNIYARGALGETLAMIFMPLLIAGLYHVIRGNKKYWPLLAISISGLVQTHILSSFIAIIICVLCGIVFIVPIIIEKRLIPIIKSVLLTFLLNLWFIIPFLHFYYKGNLNTLILQNSLFSGFSLEISGLLEGIRGNNNMFLTFGISIVVCAVMSITFLICEKSHKKLRGYILFLVVLGCIFTYMILHQFPGRSLMNIKLVSKMLMNIQFPWRFLGPASLIFIITGCISMQYFKYTKKWITQLIMILSIITILNFIQYKESSYAYDSYFAYYSSSHESKIIGIPREYNALFYYPNEWKTKNKPISNFSIQEPIASNSDVVTLSKYKRTGTKSTVTYVCNEKDQYVIFPVQNYLGYVAFEDGNIKKTITDQGILLSNDGQPHTITLQYKGYISYTISFIISLLTLFLFCGYYIYNRKLERTKPNG